MTEAEVVIRGVEIAGGLLAQLGMYIAKQIEAGQDEEAATRGALMEMSMLPKLTLVRPKVEALIAEARKPRTHFGEEATTGRTIAINPPPNPFKGEDDEG